MRLASPGPFLPVGQDSCPTTHVPRAALPPPKSAFFKQSALTGMAGSPQPPDLPADSCTDDDKPSTTSQKPWIHMSPTKKGPPSLDALRGSADHRPYVPFGSRLFRPNACLSSATSVRRYSLFNVRSTTVGNLIHLPSSPTCSLLSPQFCLYIEMSEASFCFPVLRRRFGAGCRD